MDLLDKQKGKLKQQSIAYYHKNKDRINERKRQLRKIGMLVEPKRKGVYVYESLKVIKKRLEKQTKIAGRLPSSTCEICDEPEKEHARTVFDHNHKTGKFRGWLCQRCNRALGMVKDDKELLKKLIKYLEAND